MGDLIVRSSGDTGLAINQKNSVLGERQARIPVGGKIRSGIKVLTPAARKNKQAAEIYDQGVAKGADWSSIEKRIREQCRLDKSPLMPKNVPYFTVRRSDFKVPQNADLIMEMYGEDVGGVRRLVTFPVVFATDNWQANMPHALKAYTRNQLQFWSDYDQEGNRHCYTKQQVAVDQRARRAHRTFGGRPTVLRQDNGGKCDPDNCPEYQQRKCTLSGGLLFFIPGIPGSSAIELPTTSFYALQQAREKMEMVAYLRGGRISGTHNGKPIFYLTKSEQEVSMIDQATGEPKRVRQFLVTLEADIDMLQVFQAAERRLEHAGEDGAAAAAALSLSDSPDEEPDTADDVVEAEYIEAEPTDDSPQPTEHERVAMLRQQVMDLLDQADIQPAVFSSWIMSERDSDGWGKSLPDLEWARDELTEALSGDLQAWKAERGLDAPF